MNAKHIIIISIIANIILIISLLISMSQTNEAVENTDRAISLVKQYQNLTEECLRGWEEALDLYINVDDISNPNMTFITREEAGLK